MPFSGQGGLACARLGRPSGSLVNLPLAICLTYVAGVITALSSRAELRGTPRPSLATSAFRAFMAYTVLVLVPIAVYFYVFHGDWFLLYLLDTARIPSAVALLIFVLQACVGAFGFASAAHLVRMQRDNLAVVIGILVLMLGAGLLTLAHSRVVTVGSFAQFHGAFGLEDWTKTTIFPAVILFGTILVVGLVHCCARIHWGARRATSG